MCEEKIKIYKPIIDGFGEEKQKIKAIEELSELEKELCKNLNGLPNIAAITEEMADVSIMLDQLKIIFNNEKEMQQKVAEKIERTYKMLGL